MERLLSSLTSQTDREGVLGLSGVLETCPVQYRGKPHGPVGV